MLREVQAKHGPARLLVKLPPNLCGRAPAPAQLHDRNRLIHQLLVALICPGQLEGIRGYCLTLLYAGDHIGAAEPVGFLQVGLRPAGGMVGMGMIEADNLFIALAAFALNANQFFRIDAVTVLRRISAGISGARDR